MQKPDRNTGHRSRLPGMLTALGLVAMATSVHAGYEITRLTQIADNGAASDPGNFVTMNGQYYFAASTNETGRELWVSDGTADGTHLLRDFFPGPYNSSPSGLTVLDTPYGTRLIFEANDGTLARGLWASDGTADGSQKITTQDFEYISTPVKAGDMLYFAARDADHGWELWVTQGTQATTRLVKDIKPGTGDSSPSYLTPAVPADGTIYFSAEDGTHGRELWISDGTDAGTRMVEDISPDDSEYYHLRDIAPNGSGGVWFSANDGTNGTELWESDGTAAGTSLVADIQSGAGSSYPEYITPVTGGIVFAAQGANGTELWESNGSTTAELADIRTGLNSAYPEDIVFWNGNVYFTAEDGTHGRELWSSTLDGTATLVQDILPGSEGSGINALKASANHLWFTADDGTHGREMWAVDTGDSAYMLKDAAPGSASGTSSYSFTPIASPDGVLYPVDDGTHGSEPWFSAGTAASTAMIADIHAGSGPAIPVSFEIPRMISLDGTLLFAAGTRQHGIELWSYSDGQAKQVLDINPGRAGSEPYELTRLGDHVYFSAETDTNGRELWRTDGTAAGTILLKEINASPLSSSSYPAGLKVLDGKLLFTASDSDDQELWVSDGTTAGTRELVDINPGIESGEPARLTLANGKLAFTANDGTTGTELWVTAGTAASTHRLTDIAPGTASPDIDNLTASGNQLFFTATDASHGEELWISDLTGAGTRLVEDIHTGGDSSPRLLTAVGDGGLAFFAEDAAKGTEPYFSDGTAEGTARIADITPDAGDTTAFDIAELNGMVYLAVLETGLSGNLHRYDPAQGTLEKVDGINPSITGFRAMFALEGNLFMPGTDSTLDIELWQTDGTAEGSVQTADLAAGPRSGVPLHMGTSGQTAYFAASDENHSYELWQMRYKAEPDGSGGDSGDGSGDGTDGGSGGGTGGSGGGGGGGGSLGLPVLICLLLAAGFRRMRRF